MDSTLVCVCSLFHGVTCQTMPIYGHLWRQSVTWGEMRDSDWSRQILLRSDWSGPSVAPYTTRKNSSNEKKCNNKNRLKSWWNENIKMILTYRLTPLSRSKIIGHTRGWRLSGSLQWNPLLEFCGRVSWNLLLMCVPTLKSLKRAGWIICCVTRWLFSYLACRSRLALGCGG